MPLKIQIKITVRYNCTLLEWLKVKTLTTPKRTWSNRNSHTLPAEVQATAALKKISTVSYKLNTLMPYDLAIKLLDIYPKELEACPHKNFHTNVYNKAICRQLYSLLPKFGSNQDVQQ